MKPLSDTPLLAEFVQPEQTLQLLGSPAPQPGSLREALEQFIGERFAHTYGARISQFMPELLGLTRQQSLQAVVGLRPAASQPLFLEHYLAQPVEQLISARGMPGCRRDQIIEVGNLAALAPGGARLLIIALTHYLYQRGFQWVVFTGTALLLNSFQRLTLSPLLLGQADPECLGEERHAWGSYYSTRPQVMAGFIPEGYRQLHSRDMFQRLNYQPAYAPLPTELSHACA